MITKDSSVYFGNNNNAPIGLATSNDILHVNGGRVISKTYSGTQKLTQSFNGNGNDSLKSVSIDGFPTDENKLLYYTFTDVTINGSYNLKGGQELGYDKNLVFQLTPAGYSNYDSWLILANATSVDTYPISNQTYSKFLAFATSPVFVIEDSRNEIGTIRIPKFSTKIDSRKGGKSVNFSYNLTVQYKFNVFYFT